MPSHYLAAVGTDSEQGVFLSLSDVFLCLSALFASLTAYPSPSPSRSLQSLSLQTTLVLALLEWYRLFSNI